MIYIYRLLILILFTIIQYKYLNAQNIKFEHITARDGLSQASVTSIEQDSLGFLWFGTYDGLNRYDGYSFKVFKKNPKNPNSISHNFIRCTFVDHHGTLWIGTQGGGLNRFDHEKERFISYQYDSNDPQSISHNEIYTLFEDISGKLWIGTWGGGINKVEFKNGNRDSIIFKRFQHDSQNPISLCDNKVSSIQQDKDGMLWIGTREGISILDPRKEEFVIRYVHDPQNPQSVSGNNVSDILLDKKDNLWISTWGAGLNIYDFNQDRFIRFKHNPKNLKSISSDVILDMFADQLGNIWFGTWGGGLNKLDYKSLSKQKKMDKEEFQRFIHDENDLQSISGNSIYDIFEDRSGILWIATDWDGINKYDPSDNAFQYHMPLSKTENKIGDNATYAIYKDKKEILWLGTRSNGLVAIDINSGESTTYMNDPNDPHSISNNIVRAIYEDHSGNLWIGTETGLNRFDRYREKFIRYYTDPDDPSQTNIMYIYEDSNNDLWLGTWRCGLLKFDPRINEFTTYEYDPNYLNSFPDDIIWCITEDKSGQLWFGTDKSGVVKFDQQNGGFIPYKHDENNPNTLSDNKVLSILAVTNGDMWLGTTTGLNRMVYNKDPEVPFNFEYYTIDNGLYSNTVQGILADKQGNLWLCNGDYLTELNLKTNKIRGFHAYDKLQIGEFFVNAIYKDKIKGNIYVGGIEGFTEFHPDSIDKNSMTPTVALTDFKIFGQSISVDKEIDGRKILDKTITHIDELELNYKDDVFSFEFSALHYNSPEFNQYAYKLEEFETEWNYVNSQHRMVTYTNLDPGEYIFRAKASNDDGVWNETGTSLKIIITPPIWATWWFRMISGLFILLSIVIIYKTRTNQIRKRNAELAEINTRLNIEIEEKHKIENEIKLLNMDLERRVKHRTEELESFAYSVSHDLRAPLRSMQGFSHELIEGLGSKLEKKYKNYLNRVITASQYMSRLIDDLLRLSRVTRTIITKEKVDISNIAQQIEKSLKILEPKRKVDFDIEQKLEAYGDKNLIRLALENLINNAWKFTDNLKDVTIEVKKVRYNAGTAYIVRDNGIGFEMKYVDKLFEPFHRMNFEHPGTGIGLATVKRIIELHGGAIWAEGKINVGATFYFTLPN